MAWNKRYPRWMGTAAWVAVLCAGSAVAQGGPAMAQHEVNRTYLGQDLLVPEGQQAGNVMCLFCSAQIEGDVTGRVVVLFGNLSVTGKIGGNVVVLDGNAVLDESAHVAGDTVVLFGNAVYETEDVLAGSAWVVGGHASSFDARSREQRRFSLSPKMLLGVVLLGLGLLVLLVIVAGGRRRRPLHAGR